MTTKEQLIAMAREAGAVFNVLLHARHDYVAFTSGELEKFATLVGNAKLEEAFSAVSLLSMPTDEDNFEAGCMYAMNAIRNLKEPTT